MIFGAGRPDRSRKEQVRVAQQVVTKAQLVTSGPAANDGVNGDDPKRFQEDLLAIVSMIEDDISERIVVANVPDLTRLPRFRASPNPHVTPEPGRLRSGDRGRGEQGGSPPLICLPAR